MRAILLGLLLALMTTPALAQDQSSESTYTPAVMGLGGAFRGVSGDPANLELNPGAMGLANSYALDLSFGAQGDLGLGVGRLLVVDGKTRPGVAAGFGVEFGWAPTTPDAVGWEVVGALDSSDTLRAQGRAFTFGLGVPLSREGTSSLGVNVKVAREAIEDETPTRTLSGDAGLYLRPIPQLAVGLVGNNLRPTGRADSPTTAALGAALYVIPQVILAADGVLDFTTQEGISGAFHIGVEGTSGGLLPLRFGFYTEPNADGSYSRYLTAGVGVLSAPLSLAYSIRVEVTAIGESASILYHVFGLSAGF